MSTYLILFLLSQVLNFFDLPFLSSFAFCILLHIPKGNIDSPWLMTAVGTRILVVKSRHSCDQIQFYDHFYKSLNCGSKSEFILPKRHFFFCQKLAQSVKLQSYDHVMLESVLHMSQLPIAHMYDQFIHTAYKPKCNHMTGEGDILWQPELLKTPFLRPVTLNGG